MLGSPFSKAYYWFNFHFNITNESGVAGWVEYLYPKPPYVQTTEAVTGDEETHTKNILKAFEKFTKHLGQIFFNEVADTKFSSIKERLKFNFFIWLHAKFLSSYLFIINGLDYCKNILNLHFLLRSIRITTTGFK